MKLWHSLQTGRINFFTWLQRFLCEMYIQWIEVKGCVRINLYINTEYNTEPNEMHPFFIFVTRESTLTSDMLYYRNLIRGLYFVILEGIFSFQQT